MHLLLHIGPPKTGSTAIQKSLGVNRDALSAAGILSFFRRSERENPLSLHALGARYRPDRALEKWPFSQQFESVQATRDWSAEHWRDLARAVQASDADLCVISSEHLGYGVDVPAVLVDFQKIFSGVTTLAYVRDPAALYFSSMQQQLRTGKRLLRLRTPENYPYRHREEVEKHAEVLGAENVIVRNFSRDNLRDRDVVQDFFAQFERFGKTVQAEPVQANESIPGAALALLMLINETNGPDGHSRAHQRLVRRLQVSQDVARLPLFPPEMPLVRKMIRGRAAQDCAWLNRTFLVGQTLLPEETGPVPDYPGDEVWRAELRDALLAYLTPEALAVLGPEVVKL